TAVSPVEPLFTRLQKSFSIFNCCCCIQWLGMKATPCFQFFAPLLCQLAGNSISQPKRHKIRSAFLFPVRQITSCSLNISMFIKCAKRGALHFARGSGLQTRWPHRLEVYVPNQARLQATLAE